MTKNTYLLTELSPSWEAANCAATQELPAFYGTRRFITMFTRAFHWSLSWARSTQLTPSHPISLRYILILFTHLHLGLPSGLFPSEFPTNILYTSSSPHSCYIPAHLILFDLIILIMLGEVWSSSLCSFLRPPITSSLFGPNILKHAPSVFLP
jgi:hypothetical protein